MPCVTWSPTTEDMSKTLYTLLGVPRDADAEVIRDAVNRRRALLAPDDSAGALALREAWSTLGHPQRRAAYDASLHHLAQQADAVAATTATAGATAARRARRAQLPVAEPTGISPLWWWVGAAVVLAAAGLFWRQSHKGAQRAAELATQQAAAGQGGAAIARPALTQVGGDATAPAMPTAQTQPALAAAPAAGALSPEALFAAVAPSVVRINAAGEAGDGSLGSGVVMGREEVLTNCHVVRRSNRLKVRHASGEFDARLQLADEQHDLCRLSVPGLAAPSVTLAGSEPVRVGQKVFAIGSPQGLDLTLSDGLVSSLRSTPDGEVIQTTAPVSPGSSGGGLFNETGQLVGLVTFQSTSGQNLNFAVPVSWIQRMSATQLGSGERSRAMQIGANTPDAAKPDSPVNLLVGSWQCYGPITGRGLTMVLEASSRVTGTFEGKPFAGRYALQNGVLHLMSGTTASFQVEELKPGRMVLNSGEARRLVCSRN